ncbi:MAG TPA: thioredoxin domain-containing protein [Vicinamibacteria bacterium]
MALAGCRPGNGTSQSATHAAAAAPGGDAVAAEVGGVRITVAEVDRKAAGSLERIRSEEYEIRKQALDELVAEKLFEREAAARGLSKEALVKAEIDDQVAAPTHEQIEDFYIRRGGQSSGYTVEQLTPQIERSLREQARSSKRSALLAKLKEKDNVKIALREPRAEVMVPDGAPTLGPAGAKVTVVEFLDYECPYCHRVQDVVEQLLHQNQGRVRFVHREYLIGKPRSMEAARAARCAGEQGKFWEYHRSLLTQPDMSDASLDKKAQTLGLDSGRFQSCRASDRYDAAIRQATENGAELGVSGTPTFFINGRRLVGVRPVESFQQVIDEELKGG